MGRRIERLVQIVKASAPGAGNPIPGATVEVEDLGHARPRLLITAQFGAETGLYASQVFSSVGITSHFLNRVAIPSNAIQQIVLAPIVGATVDFVTTASASVELLSIELEPEGAES